MAATTIDTDTELSAVNAILGAIGQSPISQLKDPTTGTVTNANPEVQFIYNLLRDSNVDVQAEGWHFNIEKHVTYTPDANGKITIADNILKIDVTEGWRKRSYDVVRRYNTTDKKYYLYDKYDHTDDWSDHTEINLDIIKLYSFDDLPTVFQRYIIARASRIAATQLVANRELTQLIATQETLARASLIEYECNQANTTMFGFPEDSSYTTYQPWRNLRR